MINAISNVMTSNLNTYYVKESEDKKRESDRRDLYSGDSSFLEGYINKITAVEPSFKDSSDHGSSRDDKSSSSTVRERPSSSSSYSVSGSSGSGFGNDAAVYSYRSGNNAYRRHLALQAYGLL